MPEYLVQWRIQVDADSPEDAARDAWAAIRREGSVANVFDVTDVSTYDVTVVDLDELDAEGDDV